MVAQWKSFSRLLFLFVMLMLYQVRPPKPLCTQWEVHCWCMYFLCSNSIQKVHKPSFSRYDLSLWSAQFPSSLSNLKWNPFPFPVGDLRCVPHTLQSQIFFPSYSLRTPAVWLAPPRIALKHHIHDYNNYHQDFNLHQVRPQQFIYLKFP